MAPIPKFKSSPIDTPVASFDEPAIREHIMMLHQIAAGRAGKFVVATFFSNPHGEDRAGGVISHHPVGDVEGMVEAVMSHASTQNANVYICPNLMRPTLERGKKGTEADVTAVLALVADMDSDTGLSGTMPVEPNYVVESSPGNYQCFLLLDTAMQVPEAKALASALKRGANADHCTVDMAHVWRVPGTYNWPNAKKLARGRAAGPVAVTIAEPWQGTLSDVADLHRELEPWAGSTVSATSVAVGDLPDAADVKVGLVAQAMLAADNVGDRSAHAARVIEHLAYDGLTAEQACAVFLSATGNWFARYERKDPVADFTRAWGKFGAPRAEEIERGAQVAAALVAKHRNKTSGPTKDLVPANDNKDGRPDTPPMHPDPYNPAVVGGLIADIAKWITSTAVIPVEELSLAAAMALIAGVFGSRALTPSNSGVNVFLTTMVKTAGGKGRPPGAIRALADKATPGAVSNGDPTSYAAFERILRKNSSVVTVMDEFGLTLQGVNAKKQDPAAASIRKFLLAIYDQGNSVFDGKAYASADTKKDDSPIEGPALTVLSMTTPETLMKGVSHESVTDGFLNRFVFVESPPRQDAIKPPDLSTDRSPPSAIVHDLQRAITSFPVKLDQPGKSAKEKHRVPFYGGLKSEAHVAWERVFLWQYNRAWNDTETKLRGRAAENTIRLATLRAISTNPHKPFVTAEDIYWAWAIVYRSIATIEACVRGMAGSEQEELRNAIIDALKAKEGVQYRSRIMRLSGIKHASMPEFNAAMAWLYASGAVADVSEKQDGSKFMLISEEAA
jgi:hypothetical protein